MSTYVLLDYAEVKARWLECYNGSGWKSQPDFRHPNSSYRRGQHNKWIGSSADQMAEWLRTGFSSPEFPIGDDYMPHAEQQQLAFGEEGDLDLTLAWSGYDYPYLEWEKVETKPGIRVEAQMNFSAYVNPKIIAEYGAWLAGTLSGLEAQGYDIELDLVSIQDNLYRGIGRDDRTVIRVKKENELTDFTEWSPLFAPSGFRMLFFTAYALGADKLGKKVCPGLGRPRGQGFKASWNEETATLFIGTNSGASTFPIEQMTQSVQEVMGW